MVAQTPNLAQILSDCLPPTHRAPAFEAIRAYLTAQEEGRLAALADDEEALYLQIRRELPALKRIERMKGASLVRAAVVAEAGCILNRRHAEARLAWLVDGGRGWEFWECHRHG